MEALPLLFLTRTLEVVGEILVAYMAIRVHHRVWRDHKIDEQVFDIMSREQRIGFFGIFLILSAYIIEGAIFIGIL